MTELQLKWIEALESGEYKQGKGQLRDGDQYCCLGVACDVYDKATDQSGESGWINKPMGPHDNSYVYRYGKHTLTTQLSYPHGADLAEIFGINDSVEESVMTMNDVDNKNFIEIAAYLRELFQ